MLLWILYLYFHDIKYWKSSYIAMFFYWLYRIAQFIILSWIVFYESLHFMCLDKKILTFVNLFLQFKFWAKSNTNFVSGFNHSRLILPGMQEYIYVCFILVMYFKMTWYLDYSNENLRWYLVWLKSLYSFSLFYPAFPKLCWLFWLSLWCSENTMRHQLLFSLRCSTFTLIFHETSAVFVLILQGQWLHSCTCPIIS